MVDVRFSHEEVTSIKRRFNHQLEPIKVMLVNKKNDMTREEWIEFIDRTRRSVLDHPNQYLDHHTPNTDLVEFIINRIFNDFIDNFKLGQHLHR